MRTLIPLLVVALCWGCEQSTITGVDEELEASRVASHAGTTTEYEVTIENLTYGQPLSPGVVVTHSRRSSIFNPGRLASEGIRLIAENGDPTMAVQELSGQRGIDEVVATDRPVGCVGCPGPFSPDLTVNISTHGSASRLSLAVMLICTNDGFVGLRSVELPHGHETKTYYAGGYDAGTEYNAEDWNSVVDPCGAIGPVAGPQDGTNERTATSRPIKRHRGIRGIADLTDAHDWHGPVARITIKRLS